MGKRGGVSVPFLGSEVKCVYGIQFFSGATTPEAGQDLGRGFSLSQMVWAHQLTSRFDSFSLQHQGEGAPSMDSLRMFCVQRIHSEFHLTGIVFARSQLCLFMGQNFYFLFVVIWLSGKQAGRQEKTFFFFLEKDCRSMFTGLCALCSLCSLCSLVYVRRRAWHCRTPALR